MSKLHHVEQISNENSIQQFYFVKIIRYPINIPYATCPDRAATCLHPDYATIQL